MVKRAFLIRNSLDCGVDIPYQYNDAKIQKNTPDVQVSGVFFWLLFFELRDQAFRQPAEPHSFCNVPRFFNVLEDEQKGPGTFAEAI